MSLIRDMVVNRGRTSSYTNRPEPIFDLDYKISNPIRDIVVSRGKPQVTPYLMGYPVPENNPYQVINNYATRYQAAGIPMPQREEKGTKNLLMTALNILDRPRNAVVSAIGEAVKPGDGQVLKAFGEGLTGKRKTNVSDIIAQGDKKTFGQKALGFVGDVLLDPLTYVTGGTAAVGKTFGTKAGQKALAQSVQKQIAAGRLTQEQGKEILSHGINRFVGKKAGERVSIDDVSSVVQQAKANQQALRQQLYGGDNVKSLVKSRAGIQSKVLPGLGSKSWTDPITGTTQTLSKKERALTRIDNLSTTKQNMFYTGIRDAAQSGPLTNVERVSIASKVSGGDANVTRELINLPDHQLRAAEVIADTFGSPVVGARALSLAKRFNPDYAEDLYRAGAKEIAVRKELANATEEVAFANGLSRVYDDISKQYYLKFMGRPFLNLTTNPVSKAVGKGFQSAYQSSKVVSGLTDSIAKVFNPHYISLSNKYTDPKRYEQLRQAEQIITEQLQRETAIPKHALDMVVKAFPQAILQSPKLRTATAYFIEGGPHVADDVVDPLARKAWEEIAPTLSQQEMKQIKEAMTIHEELMTAIRDLDRQLLGEEYNAISNYVHHAFKRDKQQVQKILAGLTEKQRLAGSMDASLGAAQKRKIASIARAKKHGLDPVDDIVTLTALRYMQTWRTGLNRKLAAELQRMAKNGIVATTKKPKDGTFVRLSIPGLEDLKLWVDPELQQQLKRITDMDTHNYILSVFDKFSNFMKSTQTSWNIAFLSRNMIGETLMNAFAGVSLKAHTLATDVLIDLNRHRITQVGNTVFLNGRKYMELKKVEGTAGHVHYEAYHYSPNGEVIKRVPMLNTERWSDTVRNELKKLGVKTYKLGGKEYTAYEIMRIFYDTGLGWSGITRGNLIENMDDSIRKALRTTGGGKLKNVLPWVGGPNLGDATETWTRLSHLIDRLEKGYSPKEAAQDVRKFHVDYRDLTPVERDVFRRVAPYYTYMRKNVPIQLRLLIERPGLMGMIGRLVSSSHQSLQNPITPDYLKENLALPLTADENGNVIYLNWNLPITDLTRIKYDLDEFLQANVIDMAHPFLKMAFELPEGRNFGLGLPIEKYEGEQKQLIPGVEGSPTIGAKADYALSQFGFINTARKALGQAIGTQEPDPMNPQQNAFISSLLPIRNQRKTLDSQAYEWRDIIQDDVKRLQEQGIILPTLNEIQKRQRLVPLPY